MEEILHQLIWRIYQYLQGFISGGAEFLPLYVMVLGRPKWGALLNHVTSWHVMDLVFSSSGPPQNLHMSNEKNLVG